MVPEVSALVNLPALAGGTTVALLLRFLLGPPSARQVLGLLYSLAGRIDRGLSSLAAAIPLLSVQPSGNTLKRNSSSAWLQALM